MKRQLDDAASPLRRFFVEHLPNTKAVQGEWKAATAGAQVVVASKGGPADLIGQASSLMITGAWDPTTPGAVNAGADHAVRLGWVSRDTADEYLTALTGALAKRTGDLVALAVVASLFEQIYRAGPRDAHPFARLTGGAGLDSLVGLVDPSWCEEIVDLDSTAHRALGRLRGTHPAIAGAVFGGSGDVGGADADLLCGGTLLEIKASKTLALRQRDIHQLAGYALLDYADELAIDEVAFYFSRHGFLHGWALDRLLELLAGGPVEVSDLRATLARALGRRSMI